MLVVIDILIFVGTIFLLWVFVLLPRWSRWQEQWRKSKPDGTKRGQRR